MQAIPGNLSLHHETTFRLTRPGRQHPEHHENPDFLQLIHELPITLEPVNHTNTNSENTVFNSLKIIHKSFNIQNMFFEIN